MNRFDQAKALVERCKDLLPQIAAEYESSLHQKQEIEPGLLIDIKNLMENLRSAMDYAAHELFDTYGHSTRSNPRIYFPFTCRSARQPLTSKGV